MPTSAECSFVTIALSALFLLPLFASGAAAEDEHLGVIEYEIACMPCHGLHGKGNGPQARNLTTVPSDLTRIAKSNGGRFPFEGVMAIIDGRKQVTSHGQRAMPVWGDRYRVYVEPGESQTVVERRAQDRIRALARYLVSLQVK